MAIMDSPTGLAHRDRNGGGLVRNVVTADTVWMTTTGAGAAGAAPDSSPGEPASRPGADALRRPVGHTPPWVFALAACSAGLVMLANIGGIAMGDDGVGYRAIADSLLAGDGLGYFLEDPLTIWPPLWSALMAFVAWLTPLDTPGAAVVLNMVTAAAVVYVGHGLLARLVADRHLVVLGTIVMAAGSSTVGFGHLLMTDLGFAVAVMVWLRCLIAFHDTLQPRWIALAGVTVWVGFGLRYVSLYLLALGCGWLLLDLRRRFAARVTSAIVYGAIGTVLPVVWMLRNHSLDGTFTGERTPSARGPLANAFDVVATMGQWLLPGVASDALRFWAVIGAIVLAVAAWIGYRVLTAAPRTGAADTTLRRMVTWVGSPSGLLAVQAFGYLAYMVYVRSSTALNRLELRLLNPAYFSLVVLGLVLLAHLHELDTPGGHTWSRRAVTVARIWAVANVAVGVFTAVSFATGDPFFEGNYNSEEFREIRADPVLDAVDGCDTYSNLPNALYPRVEAQWSPRRTALESSATTDDLDDLLATLGTRGGGPARGTGSDDADAACLVWIDRPPRYGHLWSRAHLADEVDLDETARSGPVTIYRMTALDGR